jgi:hypothetical protein
MACPPSFTWTCSTRTNCCPPRRDAPLCCKRSGHRGAFDSPAVGRRFCYRTRRPWLARRLMLVRGAASDWGAPAERSGPFLSGVFFHWNACVVPLCRRKPATKGRRLLCAASSLRSGFLAPAPPSWPGLFFGGGAVATAGGGRQAAVSCTECSTAPRRQYRQW